MVVLSLCFCALHHPYGLLSESFNCVVCVHEILCLVHKLWESGQGSSSQFSHKGAMWPYPTEEGYHDYCLVKVAYRDFCSVKSGHKVLEGLILSLIES